MKKLLISSIACLSMIASSVVAALPAAVDGVGIPLEVTASAQSSPIPDFALSGGDGPPA